MSRPVWSIAVLILTVAHTAADEPPQQPVPEIWQEIEREAKALVDTGRTLDYQAFRAEHKAAVRRIAAHSDRSTIETLIRTADVPLRLGDRPLMRWSLDLSARIIVCVADPKDKYGLRSAVNESGFSVGRGGIQSDWYGVALAAIDVYHDDKVRDLLLEITCREFSTPKRSNGAPATRPSRYAFGFLRTYDPEAVLPRIEAALRDEETLAFRAEVAALRLAELRSSLDYSARLKDPAERARYHDFERRLWRAWGLTRHGYRGMYGSFQHAARILHEHWTEGDERFLL